MTRAPAPKSAEARAAALLVVSEEARKSCCAFVLLSERCRLKRLCVCVCVVKGGGEGRLPPRPRHINR